MKNAFLILLLTVCNFFSPVLMAQSAAEKGYKLTLNTNGYKSQYVYLAYHYGKIKALADSALVNPSGIAIFSGADPLPGGIYFMVSPKKEILFELLLDKDQAFSMKLDTANPSAAQFTNSPLNSDFQAYTRYVNTKGAAISRLQQSLASAKNSNDSTVITTEMRTLNQEIIDYRTSYNKTSSANFLNALFAALQEPVVPPANQHPKGAYDSSYAFNYFKSHYWDGVKFNDDRLIRTPFYEARIDRYLRDMVSPDPDSIKKEIDIILGQAVSSKESFKYLLTHFVQKYINPEYMGQDAVFVHLFEKYINGNPEVNWFTDKYQKYMTDRAYSLMANLIGNPAWDIIMTDTSGKLSNLYEVKAAFTVICFWDPTCGHCKEMVPKLDSIYQAKWKKNDVKIFGVMTEGGRDNWTRYIRENNLNDWIHVHQTEAQRDAESNSGKPGFRQLYDVYQTPVLYLLDKDKRIIAKKLTYQQLDNILDLKQKKTTAKK